MMIPTPYDPKNAKKPLQQAPPDTKSTELPVQQAPQDPKSAEPLVQQTPQDPKSAETPLQLMDITKRYDVYCAETGQRIVIYRKVQIKAVQKLGVGSVFYQLVMVSGKSVFVTAHSIIKFHEHGVEAIAEVDTSL